MDSIKQLRTEVKKLIDVGDPKVVKIVHAMLEIEQESDWLNNEEVVSLIEERSAEYKSGKVKGVEWQQAKRQILSSNKKRTK